VTEGKNHIAHPFLNVDIANTGSQLDLSSSTTAERVFFPLQPGSERRKPNSKHQPPGRIYGSLYPNSSIPGDLSVSHI
jgi:hypothetical protein